MREWDYQMLIAHLYDWWRQNGYNMRRLRAMPHKQKLAIALDAQKRGWPIRKRKEESHEQLSLFA